MPTLELGLGLEREEDVFWMKMVGAEKVDDVEPVNRMLASFRIPIRHLTINAR